MYFLVLLWSLVIFASFGGFGEALRSSTAEDFPQKNFLQPLAFWSSHHIVKTWNSRSLILKLSASR